jgi:hypothetical protein
MSAKQMKRTQPILDFLYKILLFVLVVFLTLQPIIVIRSYPDCVPVSLSIKVLGLEYTFSKGAKVQQAEVEQKHIEELPLGTSK